MAVPTSFEESNFVSDGKCGEVDGLEYSPICGWLGTSHHGTPVQIYCQKISAQELSEINRTGRLWILFYGPEREVFFLSGINPFQQQNTVDKPTEAC